MIGNTATRTLASLILIFSTIIHTIPGVGFPTSTVDAAPKAMPSTPQPTTVFAKPETRVASTVLFGAATLRGFALLRSCITKPSYKFPRAVAGLTLLTGGVISLAAIEKKTGKGTFEFLTLTPYRTVKQDLPALEATCNQKHEQCGQEIDTTLHHLQKKNSSFWAQLSTQYADFIKKYC